MMYDEDWPVSKKLAFWCSNQSMYFVPELPPNLEAAVRHVVREELRRAAAEAASTKQAKRGWGKRW